MEMMKNARFGMEEGGQGKYDVGRNAAAFYCIHDGGGI